MQCQKPLTVTSGLLPYVSVECGTISWHGQYLA